MNNCSDKRKRVSLTKKSSLKIPTFYRGSMKNVRKTVALVHV